MQGNLRFKIDWGGGGLYSEGRFNGGFFLRCDFGGLIFGGAYFWNFTVPRQLNL